SSSISTVSASRARFGNRSDMQLTPENGPPIQRPIRAARAPALPLNGERGGYAPPPSCSFFSAFSALALAGFAASALASGTGSIHLFEKRLSGTSKTSPGYRRTL